MKRGNIYFWYAAAVALMAIAGCTKTVHTPENGKHSIGFNVQESVKAAVTGADDITKFEVWGWYGSGTARDKNVFNGTEVYNTGGGWTYDNLQYWVPDMNYTFYAVHPIDAGECSNGIVKVENFDCSATGSDAVDLMTAGPVEGRGNMPSNVIFKFRHELAKVKFTVKTADPDGVTVSLLKLYGISAQGSLTKPQEGNASWSLKNAVGSDNTPYSVNKKEVVLNAGNSYTAEPFGELLLPPHDAALAEARLSFSYYYGSNSSQIKSADIPLAAGTGGITSWEAGKSYNYTVEIQANRDIKINVTVTDWDERDTSVTWTPNN